MNGTVVVMVIVAEEVAMVIEVEEVVMVAVQMIDLIGN